MRDKKSSDDSKKSQFLQDMARRSLEVPTDFLDKIEEEKKTSNSNGSSNSLGKKYPFNRTTTPNTLREHLKETLARNLGSSTDLAETIHAIRDDEILDTFNIDSENIETPPVQRRGQFRHKSLRLSEQEEDNESDIGSDFAGRRKNHKFKTISGDGRPLGDRELAMKKKRASNNDLSEGRTDLEDELGSGLFDRFSSARKTLNRSSIRKKKDEDTVSLSESLERKSDSSNWRNKLANRFRKSVVENDLEDMERLHGLQSKEEPALRREASDYLGQQTPMTEPTRRKPFNFEEGNSDKTDKKYPSGEISNSNRLTRNGSARSKVGDSKSSARKSSYIMPGDYDSELVDGKYVTSVPIINVEQAEGQSSGNIRPGHSLKDLKKPVTRKNSLIERLSKSKEPRAGGGGGGNSNVFDRLSNGRSASRSNLTSSRPSLVSEARSSSSSLARGSTPSRATSLPPDKPRTALNKIKDLSKDITKNLRKGKEEGLSSSVSVIQPRNSTNMFSDRERKPMSNLNGGSNPSINSSTRSLNKSATLNATRQNQRSTENVRNARNVASISNGTAATMSRIGNKQPTSSKENLSRSSSSASRSSVTNSMSRNGSVRTGVTSPTSLSTSNIRNSPAAAAHNTLPRSKSASLKNDDIPSYMKPTAARTKKVLGANTESQPSLRKTSINKMSTSSRVTPVAPRPTRR